MVSRVIAGAMTREATVPRPGWAGLGSGGGAGAGAGTTIGVTESVVGLELGPVSLGATADLIGRVATREVGGASRGRNQMASIAATTTAAASAIRHPRGRARDGRLG